MIPNRLPKCLLIIDDSALQREFAAELCRDIGIESIRHAANGFEAMEILGRDSAIEAIILDLEMPGMDGVQVLHELVRLKLDPAVVVASSRESVLLNVVESMGKSLGLRLLGVLQKPVTLEQLAGSLGRYSAITIRDEQQSELPRGPELSEVDVQQALLHGEFISYFQPKVALFDGRLCGVEALIRWQHPQHGLLAPAAFIEMVESSQYISPVTLHMLDISLQYCKVWHAAGLPLCFSINVSSRSLADAQLADAIIDRVGASGIAPGFVILEITESAIMTDLSIALGTLARLRLKGFGISIDDYGTGFSCMLQLSRVPCTELKIDRAFVNGASTKPHLRIMLESALDIARKLNLKVVAEGMETREDWQLLRELECGEGQGYFVAKPMPGDALLPWWRANKARLQAL
jgi:EAL domain-containing protein (putative c-di-GMP-specific phosphodiesterase class I)/FixJ family two-component response regulator